MKREWKKKGDINAAVCVLTFVNCHWYFFLIDDTHLNFLLFITRSRILYLKRKHLLYIILTKKEQKLTNLRDQELKFLIKFYELNLNVVLYVISLYN